MICKPCRAAAELASQPEVIYQYLDGRPQQVMTGRNAAREFHKQCPEAARRRKGLTAVELSGSVWCDCQHVVAASVSAS